MQTHATKRPKHQDQIDLERAAEEGMAGPEPVDHAPGAPWTMAMMWKEGLALVKARPLEAAGVAFGFGLVVGAAVAAIARR